MTHENFQFNQPLVSIIMPCYKAGEFIDEALESIAQQTYQNWELIAVDDAGPEDGTLEKLQAFAREHPKNQVKIIRHEKNMGVAAARRTAFGQTQGECIAFLDPDDAYLPEKLEQSVRCLQVNPGVILTHGPILPLGQPDDPKLPNWFSMPDGTGIYDYAHYERYFMSNHICNSTVIAKKQALRPEYFPENMVFQFEDWTLWRLAAKHGLFAYVDHPLTHYRYHPSSFTTYMRARPSVKSLAFIESNAFVLAGTSEWCMRLKLVSGILRGVIALIAGGHESLFRQPMSSPRIFGYLLVFCFEAFRKLLFLSYKRLASVVLRRGED